jgi:UDP-galactopyranose mutase
MKVNIIGCGLSGVTAAILLKEKGHDVEIFECRDHIAGNCFDKKNDDGVTVHKYGSHIFHTNNEKVWEFLNRFTKFNNYQHRVRANTKEGLISIPFSKKTAEELGRDLDPLEIQELLFRDYSERHWGIPWEQLPKSISSRVPNKREDYDDRYFTDKYQGIPENGYTEMFKAMLEGIPVHLGVGKNEYKKYKCDKTVYTGKPDEYYNFEYGKLPYRSLIFEHKRVKQNKSMFSWDLGSVINECNKKPFNRSMDSSVYLNETAEYTTITRDHPEEHNETNEAIYPKTFGEGPEIFAKYKKLQNADESTIFLGRLATYKYLDMWMAVAQVQQKLKAF